ncbi:DDRGK domain-containing protein 1-like [Eriocheir sinensis]|uniref:DDRGK domain-containing protein 1-like n=1 Tax=Eriocheir sinensis TaxID=95602 RepID=UPI0021C6EA61|nr:DDRGK domain-containing protein 1-like [Eriocheir sinensis]
MSAVLVYTVLAVLVGVVIAFLSFYRKKEEKGVERVRGVRARAVAAAAAAAAAADDGGGGGGGGGRAAQPPPNRVAANRNARARMRAAAQRHAGGGDSDDEGASEDEATAVGDNIALPEGRVGKKKLAKLQAKADKRVMREMEEREREERKERKEREEEERKKDDEREAEEEARKEEEERKAREEKERREEEEYQRMKEEFLVEEEGFEEEEEDEEEKKRNLLNHFVSHIKSEKVVVLEDLAAMFKLKTQDVIQRVNDLQKEGTLTGVIDDRGKFIYISREELEGVAKFIRQRGRVSLAELAESSASLITLTPDNTATATAASA